MVIGEKRIGGSIVVGQAAQPGRSVISKALGIMSAFESLNPPVSVQELAEYAQVPLSTTHRIIGELIDWGALERDKNGGLHLGGRLTALASTGTSSMRQLFLPHLEELCAVTGHTVSLGLREGDEVRISERCYGQVETPRLTRVGSRLRLDLTAMGKTLLAHAPPWLQETYLSRVEADTQPKEPTAPARLKSALSQIKSDGFAHTTHRIPEEVEVLAVPVHHQQRIICALDLMRPTDHQVPIHRFLPALQATANTMQAELDHFQALPAWDTG
ncbi:IclR family transcriptional regulator [Glutamicibacter sp. MNS18]|uniref:IclR family transcriptional regulator n=1 Tax=Glutamicibacter sp. MNS18 TaxID=2989817 RepID=UPI00223686F1|nr:IclR family transcriptional regulator [Glutamicibacter sp. MNS18]MCW4465493.1 IclR family transcriptional regulator [Glutamicibacter sp. MNS18]